MVEFVHVGDDRMMRALQEAARVVADQLLQRGIRMEGIKIIGVFRESGQRAIVSGGVDDPGARMPWGRVHVQLSRQA